MRPLFKTMDNPGLGRSVVQFGLEAVLKGLMLNIFSFTGRPVAVDWVKPRDEYRKLKQGMRLQITSNQIQSKLEIHFMAWWMAVFKNQHSDLDVLLCMVSKWEPKTICFPFIIYYLNWKWYCNYTLTWQVVAKSYSVVPS